MQQPAEHNSEIHPGEKRHQDTGLSPPALVLAFAHPEFVEELLSWQLVGLLWLIMAHVQVQILLAFSIETRQTSSSASEESHCAQSYKNSNKTLIKIIIIRE